MLFNPGVGLNSRKRGREHTSAVAATTTTTDARNPIMSIQYQPQLININQLRNNSSQQHQITNAVSTGLQLASGDQLHQQQQFSHLPPHQPSLNDFFASHIKQQQHEIDHFLQVQGEQLRRTLEEKRKRHYDALIGAMEESMERRLREKETEVEKAWRRNRELEARASQLIAEARAWQVKACEQEVTAAQLQQAMMKEAEDAESVYVDSTGRPSCKGCGKRFASLVLLPCRHLCLCIECDVEAQCCPLCRSIRTSSVEVFICYIPLPPWVLEEISKNPDLVYTDRSGRRNPEYISLGCDRLPVLRGRTPIQVYSDYMRSFRERFKNYLGDVIVEIQVGMDPCGELRYPSYPESNGTWRFPGIGEFQCYDKYMKASLAASAHAVGKKSWGRGGPHDSGQYNQFPEENGFFKKEGTWNSEYGQFFLEWHSRKSLEHGDKILASAQAIFKGTGSKLSGKVAGIHWHYNTRSHAAELTAGYYNTREKDGYLPITRMFAKRGVVFNFTCMEMRDGEQPHSANCSPEGLLRQVKNATRVVGGELAGENVLERYHGGGYAQVLSTSRDGLSAFTYLRLNKRLFELENWRNLVEFVKNMSEGGNTRLPEHDRVEQTCMLGLSNRVMLRKLQRLYLCREIHLAPEGLWFSGKSAICICHEFKLCY